MFHLTCLGWLFFPGRVDRSGGRDARAVRSIAALTPFALGAAALIAFYVLPLLVFEVWLERRGDLLALLKTRWWVRGLVYGYILLMLWFFTALGQYEFIYFQF
jgi:hypothetical protein